MTREEMDLPPPEPRLEPLLLDAVRLLARDDVPAEMKDILRENIRNALRLWKTFHDNVIGDARTPDRPVKRTPSSKPRTDHRAT